MSRGTFWKTMSQGELIKAKYNLSRLVHVWWITWETGMKHYKNVFYYCLLMFYKYNFSWLQFKYSILLYFYYIVYIFNYTPISNFTILALIYLKQKVAYIRCNQCCWYVCTVPWEVSSDHLHIHYAARSICSSAFTCTWTIPNLWGLIWCPPTMCGDNSVSSSGKAFQKV